MIFDKNRIIAIYQSLYKVATVGKLPMHAIFFCFAKITAVIESRFNAYSMSYLSLLYLDQTCL